MLEFSFKEAFDHSAKSIPEHSIPTTFGNRYDDRVFFYFIILDFDPAKKKRTASFAWSARSKPPGKLLLFPRGSRPQDSPLISFLRLPSY